MLQFIISINHNLISIHIHPNINKFTTEQERKQTDHFVDEFEFIPSLFNKFFNLTTTEFLLNGLPVFFLFTHAQPVAREALDGLTVAFVLRYSLDLG
ncbi:hypothetical protein Hanom_Chr06g00574561 [Helianthus anomalus]